MKKLYFSIIALISCFCVSSQIVNIPDANFKATLVASDSNNTTAKDLNGNYFKIDANNDSEIQVSEALQVSYLDVKHDFSIPNSVFITSLEGILSFVNLQNLTCTDQQLISLNLSGLSNLITLDCSANQLTTINLNGLVKLQSLNCSGTGNQFGTLNLSGLNNLKQVSCIFNGLSGLNLTGLTNLETLVCGYNNFTTLDLSSLTSLKSFSCTNAGLMTYLNLKNSSIESNLDFSNDSSLLFICADTNQLSNIQSLVNSYGYTNCVVSDNCSQPSSDIVIIPDANFKAILLKADSTNKIAQDMNGDHFKIDANNDSQIQKSEAAKVMDLNLQYAGIASLEGIADFVNLVNLNCNTNKLTSLSFSSSPMPNLRSLQCNENNLTTLDVSGLVNLTDLHCSQNNLVSLVVSTNKQLKLLHCDDNQILELDLNSLTNLEELHCTGNKLTAIYINNGKNEKLQFDLNPDLSFICCDASQIDDVFKLVKTYGYSNCKTGTFCPFNPGGMYLHEVLGNVLFDANNNGCDSNDVAFPNLKFVVSDSSNPNKNTSIANASGNFIISLLSDTDRLTPVLEKPNYYNVSPPFVQFDSSMFPTIYSLFNQDFCITANGIHNDLGISILPLDMAVPGFEVNYKIVYQNKGTQSQSGFVILNYNNFVSSFVSASPSPSTLNGLTWNFSDLKPSETRVIDLKLKLNTPTDTPPVNGGDILNFIAAVNSQATDETPNDNVSEISQTVVNSIDPNDIICLEGNIVGPEKVGDYVNYMVRFKNTGTFMARNITVKDVIDANKFDLKSLIPVDGSHQFVTKISDSNKVEFDFYDINLPFDDAHSEGYLVFKIKTKSNLVLGDTFSNTASIVFDYNFPVDTNIATTTIKGLGTTGGNKYFSLYPNPAKDVLNIIKADDVIFNSMSIYNILGQQVMFVQQSQKATFINVSELKSGIYLIKIDSDKGIINARFIKK